MECSGTGWDLHHYSARGQPRDICKRVVAVDDAACVDGGGPGVRMHRAATAGTGNCGRWLEMVRLDSLRRCGAGREADLDLGVHTEEREVQKNLIKPVTIYCTTKVMCVIHVLIS